MICRHCGARIPEDTTICPECKNDPRSSKDESVTASTPLSIPYAYFAVVAFRYLLRFIAGVQIPCVWILFTLFACLLTKKIRKRLPEENWATAAHINNAGFYVSFLLIFLYILLAWTGNISEDLQRLLLIIQIVAQILPPICTLVYIAIKHSPSDAAAQEQDSAEDSSAEDMERLNALLQKLDTSAAEEFKQSVPEMGSDALGNGYAEEEHDEHEKDADDADGDGEHVDDENDADAENEEDADDAYCGVETLADASDSSNLEEKSEEENSAGEKSTTAWLPLHIPHFFLGIVALAFLLSILSSSLVLTYVAGTLLGNATVAALFAILSCILTRKIRKELPEEYWKTAANINNFGIYITACVLLLKCILFGDSQYFSSSEALTFLSLLTLVACIVSPISLGNYIKKMRPSDADDFQDTYNDSEACDDDDNDDDEYDDDDDDDDETP